MSDAGSTLVVKGTTLLVVRVASKVLPSLTVVKVVITCRVALVVIRVSDGVTVLTVEVESLVVVAEPSEFVGVKVDVVKITDTEGLVVGVIEIVDDS